MRLAPLYSGTRGRLVAFLEARPGATLGEAAQAVGVDHSTVDYHLHRLERAGAARRVRRGRAVRLFLNGPREEEAVTPVRSRREACLAFVRANPGVALVDVAAAVGVSRGTAWVHLRTLASEGRIVVRVDGCGLRAEAVVA